MKRETIDRIKLKSIDEAISSLPVTLATYAEGDCLSAIALDQRNGIILSMILHSKLKRFERLRNILLNGSEPKTLNFAELVRQVKIDELSSYLQPTSAWHSRTTNTIRIEYGISQVKSPIVLQYKSLDLFDPIGSSVFIVKQGTPNEGSSPS